MSTIEKYTGQVIQGDCLNVMQGFPAQSIDMILCDLPYGTTINPWDAIIDLSKLWEQYMRIIKPNGVIALTASGIFTAKLMMSNLRWYKYKIVWIKSKSTNFLLAKKQPLRRHEDICIFYNKQPGYSPQMIAGKPYNRGWRTDNSTGCLGKYSPSLIRSEDGQRYPYDIVCFDEELADDWFYCSTAENEPKRPVHPTQKPVELGRYLIRTYTKPGDIVLDNACGSGSFLEAAILEDRKFIGIEKNEGTYYQKMVPIDFIAFSRERVRRALEKMNVN